VAARDVNEVIGGGELIPALKYIFLVSAFLWIPFTYLVGGLDPFAMLGEMWSLAAAVMFFSGAVIANATAVGGGIVFNPMLQLVFGVSGYSALVLSITVQCAGMSSGTYAWYKKGEFSCVRRGHLFMMAITSALSTALFTVLLLICKELFPDHLLVVMKMASALVSLYVFAILWKEVKERKWMGTTGPTSARRSLGSGQQEGGLLQVDWRIYGWIAFGALLNVHTAVGVGELAFSHLIKYYRASTRTAVAVGVLMQAISVLTQTVLNILFLREYLLMDMVCIGLLCTMMGGRLAPFIMTRRVIEPYAKQALALTALAMGFTSAVMLLL
jgi:uncharacterized membrane protein YfcA